MLYGICRGRGLDWSGRDIYLAQEIPLSVGITATGRPVTDLLEHPFLLPTMIVEEVIQDEERLPPCTPTIVRLKNDSYLFHAASGRVWR